MNQRHLEIMQHALGLDEYGRGTGYRNHFVTGPGTTDWDDCRALTEAGLMESHGPEALYGNGFCFVVTDAGCEAVRLHSPKPPELTAGQRRYRRFLDADCGLSFGEWLRSPYAGSER